MVDTISGLASIDFRFDDWGVDVAVSGSQKGLMLPPGLSFNAASAKAMEVAKTGGMRRSYWDWHDMKALNATGYFPYTPATNLLYGLNEAIRMLHEEGLDNVFARHHRIAEGVRAAVRAWGLELCARTPDVNSDSVSAIRTPEGFNATGIVTHAAAKYGVAFGVGLGEVAGKVFRIGHLGSLTDVMMLSGLATAEMVMADLGLDIKLGSGVAAAQEVYRSDSAIASKEAA